MSTSDGSEFEPAVATGGGTGDVRGAPCMPHAPTARLASTTATSQRGRPKGARWTAGVFMSPIGYTPRKEPQLIRSSCPDADLTRLFAPEQEPGYASGIGPTSGTTWTEGR